METKIKIQLVKKKKKSIVNSDYVLGTIMVVSRLTEGVSQEELCSRERQEPFQSGWTPSPGSLPALCPSSRPTWLEQSEPTGE